MWDAPCLAGFARHGRRRLGRSLLDDRRGPHAPPIFVRGEIDHKSDPLIWQVVNQLTRPSSYRVTFVIKPDQRHCRVVTHHLTDAGWIGSKPLTCYLLALGSSQVAYQPFRIPLILSIPKWIQDGDRSSLRNLSRRRAVIEQHAMIRPIQIQQAEGSNNDYGHGRQ